MPITGQYIGGNAFILNNVTNVTIPGDMETDQADNPGPSLVSQNPTNQPDILQDIYSPSTVKGKSFASTLKGLVNSIDEKNQSKGVPLKEAFGGYTQDLYDNTNLPDTIVPLLKDMNILDEGSGRKIRKDRETEHDMCCEKIYDSLFKNGNVDYLVHFWEKTNNTVLIERSQKWLARKYPNIWQRDI